MICYRPTHVHEQPPAAAHTHTHTQPPAPEDGPVTRLKSAWRHSCTVGFRTHCFCRQKGFTAFTVCPTLRARHRLIHRPEQARQEGFLVTMLNPKDAFKTLAIVTFLSLLRSYLNPILPKLAFLSVVNTFQNHPEMLKYSFSLKQKS